MGEGDRGFGVVPGEDVPENPRVVDEAHEVLGTYSWQLLGGGVAAALLWLATIFLGGAAFSGVLGIALALVVVLYFFPITRELRLARDVLRRWDQLRVERALQSSGVSSDPRLEVAESMADRVLRHPCADQRIREATNALLRRLQRLLRDLGRIEYLTHARMTMDQGDAARSISDLQDLLDARVAEVLGQIAVLHRTVVLRDEAALEGVVTALEDLVRELEAEQDVERLLSDAERG